MKVNRAYGQPGVAVTLESLRVAHADEMWPVLADQALYQFTGGEPPGRDALVARYQAQVAGLRRPEERWSNWIVRRNDCHEAIGFVQATIVDDVADVAWLVGMQHQGQGFAVQAVTAMIAELESLGVTDLTAHVHGDHQRSQRVASAVGLRHTGALDGDGEEVWSNSSG